MVYRIELDEIEAALYGIAAITQAAVVSKPGKRGSKHIVAYIAGTNLPE
jgi:acyl-CoA synthetase (AMP-forming)/AMP-acid ligase II